MFKDIIVVENVFDDADFLIEFSRKQTFFEKENHPTESKSKWVGRRTINIGDIDQEVYNKCVSEIILKSSETCFGKITPFKIEWKWNGHVYFHKMDYTNQPTDSWLHTDESNLYAGIVYLNKNPKPNSGTTIYKNNNPMFVQNVYNRLVLYRSDYRHASQGGFDGGLDNRLTLNLFFKELNINIKS